MRLTGRGPCRNCHGMHGSGMYNCCCALPVYILFSQECRVISTWYFLFFIIFSCFFAEYHCTRLYCNMYSVHTEQSSQTPPLSLFPTQDTSPPVPFLLKRRNLCQRQRAESVEPTATQLVQLVFLVNVEPALSLDWLSGAGRAYFTRRLSQLKGTDGVQPAGYGTGQCRFVCSQSERQWETPTSHQRAHIGQRRRTPIYRGNQRDTREEDIHTSFSVSMDRAHGHRRPDRVRHCARGLRLERTEEACLMSDKALLFLQQIRSTGGAGAE